MNLATFYRSLFAFLRSLPALVFTFTLGACVTASAIFVWIIYILGYRPWPAEQAAAVINALMWFGLSSQLIVLLVIITWTFGRLDKLTFAVGPASGELDFKDDVPSPPDEPPPP